MRVCMNTLTPINAACMDTHTRTHTHASIDVIGQNHTHTHVRAPEQQDN